MQAYESNPVSIWQFLQRVSILLMVLCGTWFVLYYSMGSAGKVQSASPSPGGSVRWLSIQEGGNEWAKGSKPVLYDFTAQWCGFCKKLEADVLDDQETAGWINKSFIPVTVMDRARETGKNPAEVQELQSRYKIRGFPTLVIRFPNNDFRIQVGYPGREPINRFLQGALADFEGGKNK